jgi:hypothetical protein
MSSPKTAPLIDLNAAKREAEYPDGIPVALGDREFVLPGELPVDVLDPILDLDLATLFKQVLDSMDDDEKDLGQIVVDVLLNRPALPKELVQAIKDVYEVLFGDQHDDFLDQRPSIPDYVRLTQALLPLYGVGLGEALGSDESSESDGQTSSPTSSSTTDSTPAASGKGRKQKGSSASDG